MKLRYSLSKRGHSFHIDAQHNNRWRHLYAAGTITQLKKLLRRYKIDSTHIATSYPLAVQTIRQALPVSTPRGIELGGKQYFVYPKKGGRYELLITNRRVFDSHIVSAKDCASSLVHRDIGGLWFDSIESWAAAVSEAAPYIAEQLQANENPGVPMCGAVNRAGGLVEVMVGAT